MYNDTLEQITEDYFRELGYFTQHNISYRKDNKGVHSDIDVLAISPLTGKVIVASCKSEEKGLSIEATLRILKDNPDIKIRGHIPRKKYRELMDTDSIQALKECVFRLTNKKDFEIYTVVTKYRGDKTLWENYPLFTRNLGCSIRLLDLREMLLEIQEKINTTPSHHQLTRMLQLIKASGGNISY